MLPRRVAAVVVASTVALVPTAAVACSGGAPWSDVPRASSWSWWHGGPSDWADSFWTPWWDGDHGPWHGDGDADGPGTGAQPRPDDAATGEPTAAPTDAATAVPTVPGPVPTMTVPPAPDPSSTPSLTPTPEPTTAPSPSATPIAPTTDPTQPTAEPTTSAPEPSQPTTGTSTSMPRGDLPGWRQVFADDFTGADLSSSWGRYSGQPGGDPAGYWLPTHAVVNSGALKLLGYADSGHNASGGVAAWGPTNQTYGKYEVRFRADAGNGYAYAFLLWPVAENWPVGGEIDFAEDGGGDRQATTATLHYGANNTQVARSLKADFTQWHTIGVEWTAGKLVYTLDGKPWATVSDAGVPSSPMFLALQQQAYPCTQWSTCVDSTTPDVTGIEIDWVSVYAPK